MREMKDSGIEWIGEIPAEWTVCKVKRFYKLQTGFTPDTKKSEYYDDEYGFDWVNISDICDGMTITETKKKISQLYIDHYKPSIIPTGSLLYSFKLSVGQTAFAGKPIYSNEAIAAFLEDKKVNLHFFRYSSSFIIENAQTNIYNAKILNQDLINNALVPFPPLPEQQKIAAHLDSECAKIDDVISKSKATIEEYKKLKQSVITEAVTKGIRPNREMKDSGSVWFNDIPSDWNCQKLKFVFHIQKDIAGEEGYTVLSITQKGIIPKDLSKNEGQLAQNYSNYQFVHIGDFAMNHMDLLTGWVDISKYEGVTSPDYRVFVLNNAENNSKNYYLYMMQMCYSNKIFYGLGQGVSGFGRWRLQADKFLNFYIPIPPYEEQQEIADYLDKKCYEIDNLIAKKEQIAAELESYKKSLIYEYVTGKREVSDMTEKEETITIFDPQAARRMQMALAYKVIKQSGNDLKGRIHLMKIIYMLDCMLGLGLGINYLRYTRGPYNPIIESIEKNLSDKGIISVNTAKNYSYTVIDDSFDSKYNELFAKHNSEIEKIIDYMKRMKSSRAEKIATLYAAWNDMVIDGVQNITDKMIIDDVMNNWTENKAKTDFSTWQHILNDMKDKKIIPHGYGKHTRPRSE